MIARYAICNISVLEDVPCNRFLADFRSLHATVAHGRNDCVPPQALPLAALLERFLVALLEQSALIHTADEL